MTYLYFYILFIGCFYFTLGNMRPQLLPSVKAIQLIALAKTSYISQYGITPIPQYITDDILQLEKVHTVYIQTCGINNTGSHVMYIITLQGVKLNTPDGIVTLQGTLVTMAGANLGSHLIGGFKGSCTAL